MKNARSLFAIVGLLLIGAAASLRAEDIDLYVDNGASTGVPNILFVIDSGANFESSATPCTYGSGGSPSLGASAGGVEQCALVDAIESLPNGVVNMAIMVNNSNGFATDVRLSTDAAYHEVCTGTYGGCLVRKLTFMDAAGKASLVKFIKSWKTTGQNSATEFNVKSGGDRTANMMQEAWAYYHGKTGMSGKVYSDSPLATGCQKNFVVFIGNAFNNSGGPADSGNQSPYDGTDALTSAQVNATADQKLKISETVKFSPNSCGVAESKATTSASNWSENWADEWARLMYQQDGGATGNYGVQNIITYTIGVVDDASCKPDYPALLTTMAKHGGGQYFKTGNASEMKAALFKILNEVQAVNSVFSSASLPVSVNAQGTYLNQIFLGMFRPDSSGSPRWYGNLKQYKLIEDASGDLKLADQNGNAAISSAGTGFITPNAVSFWTSKDITSVPDNTGGFFVNDLKGVPASGFDSPDGEVVEKGGAAQQLRKQNLTATFAGAGNTTANPRRMYTYCPSGVSCVADLTDATNDFSTANVGIAANAFGDTTSIKVSSIVRSGTSATVTTSGNHGFAVGTTVTISGASQSAYNVTQALTTVNASNTFVITGLTDYPTSPSAGSYVISPPSAGAFAVSSVSRTTATTGLNSQETVTVVTSSAHGFTTTSTVQLTGITPSTYNVQVTPSAVSTNSFTFSIAIQPNSVSQNGYTAVISPTSNAAIASVALTNPSQGNIAGSSSSAHKLHVGQTITISGASDGASSKYPGTYTVVTVPTSTSFTATNGGAQPKNQSGITATVSANTSTAQPIAVGSITRAATTDAATATVSGLPANWFGAVANDTKVVTIAKASGTNTNESAYEVSNVTATCQNTGCTIFTYPISVTPSSVISLNNATAGLSSGSSVTVNAGAITRSGTTATVTGLPASNFTTGQYLTIAASGTALSSENAYLGTWQITCSGTCTSFTFGPVELSPVTPATGSNIVAYSSTTPPDKDTIIKWVRGQDNFGDEKGPGGTVTVRPSIHGDVLHSRPAVINYGDASKGTIVFYGSNDGVFRAVNGNRTAAVGSVPAGGELWSLVLPEHFTQLNRQRVNSPELKLGTSILDGVQPKDYFIDGAAGSMIKLNSSKQVSEATLYLTMRRGGRLIYALDVTDPVKPIVKWKKDVNSSGFGGMGQTWSLPQLTLLQAYNDGDGKGVPVLIFGAGYDTANDAEPPGTNSMGNGIYVVNAATGDLIWGAGPACTDASKCLAIASMTHAIPSDIRFVDRDSNGRTEKMYFGDLGGNLWRADVHTADPAGWTVTRLATLGCDSGVCGSGATPRKFFYPPTVISVKPSGAPGAYDLVTAATGDREHPLRTQGAYLVEDYFFLLKDTGTMMGSPTVSDLKLADLENAGSASDTTSKFNVDGTEKGFRLKFQQGEKAVNAPVLNFGVVFFATNRPVDSTQMCAPNLGEAKAYAVDPFTGDRNTNVLDGGGLPPTAVTGPIAVERADGSEGVREACLGCGVAPPTGDPTKPPEETCKSALEECGGNRVIPKNLRRTYWFRK